MLIDFTVKNFKSIKNELTFSLYVQENIDDSRVSTVTLQNENISLVKNAVIYGPNASGKSNILEAMLCFRSFIINSTDLKLGESIPFYQPYLLDAKSKTSPTTFIMEFIANDLIRYKYEFSFNKEEIISEELVFYPKKQEALLFRRDKNTYKWGGHLKGKKESISSETLPNNLFLSKAANSGQEMLAELYLFFRRDIRFNMSPQNSSTYTTSMLRDEGDNFRKRIIGFLQAADIGIQSIEVQELEDIPDKERIFLPDGIPDELKKKIMSDVLFRPKTKHKVFDKEELVGYQEFDLKEESTGTIKMYDIGGKIIDALDNGYTIIIDEIDSGLHSYMIKYIIDIFNDPKINTNNAQLICATHNVSIMEMAKFRRDQIWFVEKREKNGTNLFSLDEFNKSEVRKGSPFAKWYLQGRFGAIPRVDKSTFATSRADAKA